MILSKNISDFSSNSSNALLSIYYFIENSFYLILFIIF